MVPLGQASLPTARVADAAASVPEQAPTGPGFADLGLAAPLLDALKRLDYVRIAR